MLYCMSHKLYLGTFPRKCFYSYPISNTSSYSFVWDLCWSIVIHHRRQQQWRRVQCSHCAKRTECYVVGMSTGSPVTDRWTWSPTELNPELWVIVSHIDVIQWRHTFSKIKGGLYVGVIGDDVTGWSDDVMSRSWKVRRNLTLTTVAVYFLHHALQLKGKCHSRITFLNR